MMKLPFLSWLWRTESVISSAISEIRDCEWDENDATRSWMRALRRNLPSVEITDLGHPYAMAWDAVKLNGKAEHLYGDVGVFVQVKYPNGVKTEGVGFLEAKRIYPTGRYEKLDREQLKLMHKGTAHHRLAIYERKSIREAFSGLIGHGGIPLGFPKEFDSVPLFIAGVIPSSVALQLKGNKRGDLHPACLPLSFQLCARYLNGYDLDLAPALVEVVKKGGAGAPSFLLIGSVVIGGETEPTIADLIPTGPLGPYTTLDPDEEQELFGQIKKQESDTQLIQDDEDQQLPPMLNM